jgi:hypothetical protein
MGFDLFSSIADLAVKINDLVVPDTKANYEALLELAKLQQTGELAKLAAETDLMKGQMEINKVEAASSTLFVSGWRPGVGWCCVAALAVQFVVGPLLLWGSYLVGHPITVPQMNMAELMPIILGLLGLGTMRTVERLNNVASGQNGQKLK